MHWLDLIAGAFFALPPAYERLFKDGWGDEAVMERYRERAHRLPPTATVDVRYGPPRLRSDGLYERDGRFESPGIDLPASSATARFRIVSETVRPESVCLLMAAFNDHGYVTRSALGSLLARRSIGAVILENPYYGARRPVAGQPMRTVADLLVMGSAAVYEGRALLLALRNAGHERLGVSGYSMGGNIATFISSSVPFPVATAALAASHSPAPVFADGLLSRAVAWSALGGRQNRDRLRETLGLASTLLFPAPAHQAAAVLANPDADGYIPRPAFEALHRHWPESELRWLEGGHASVLLNRKQDLVQAIVDSFDRLTGL